MNSSGAHSPERERYAAGKRRAILITSYTTGAARGQNMGVLGYSYDLVARLFVPLLREWGEVIEVPGSAAELETAVQAARARQLEPIHVSFLPFHDVCLTPLAPNVVFPFWEFPDVPDHEFDNNPRNNWVATANRCALVLVAGPWTAENLRKAGIRAPIRVVQPPTPEAYFQVPPWQPDERTAIDCRPYVFPQPERVVPIAAPANETTAPAEPASLNWKRQIVRTALRAYQRLARPLVPPLLDRTLASLVAAPKAAPPPPPPPLDLSCHYSSSPELELSGVVYTSIFNSIDGRKNWEDLLTGFLHAFRDCPDATLVMKLISGGVESVKTVLDRYRGLDVAHRCKVVFLTDYLTEEQMLALARATTYYITTTKAEGYCLPVMNYLSAGRPCLSTCHTAISDYFSEEIGFVIESHEEPSAWPQDRRWRWRTSWHRIVWTSVVEQLRESYNLVKSDRAGYAALAECAREKMRQWAHPQCAATRLCAALDLLTAGEPHQMAA